MITAMIITTFLIAVFAIITVFVAHRVDSIQEVVDKLNLLNTSKVQELDSIVSSNKTDTGSLTGRLNVVQKELDETSDRINKQHRVLVNEISNRAKLDKRLNHYGRVMNVMDEHRQMGFDILDDKLLKTDIKLTRGNAITHQMLDDHMHSTGMRFASFELDTNQSMSTLCNLVSARINNANNTHTGFSNHVMQELQEIDSWIGDMDDYRQDNNYFWNTAFKNTSNQTYTNRTMLNETNAAMTYNFDKVYTNISELSESNNTIFNIVRLAQEDIAKMQQPIINNTVVVQEAPTVYDRLSANRVVIGPEAYGLDIRQNLDAQQAFSNITMKLNTSLVFIDNKKSPVFNFDANNAVLSASNMRTTCMRPFGHEAATQSVCFAPTNNETVISGGPLRIGDDLIKSTSTGLEVNNLVVSGKLLGTAGLIKTSEKVQATEFCAGHDFDTACLTKDDIIKLKGLAKTNTSSGAGA